MKSMGKFLRKRRMELGLTQQEVAGQLGYHCQFISNWERGQGGVPLAQLRKICSIYEINPNDVVELMVESYRHRLQRILHL